MKILNINQFYSMAGGAEKYFFNVSDVFKKHGHEVLEFSMQHPNNLPYIYDKYFPSFVDFSRARFNLMGFKVLARIFYSFESKRKIEKLIKEQGKPDIVHLNNIYHQISPSILFVFKKYKIPVVMTLHDYNLLCPNYKFLARDGVCERCKGEKFYNCLRHKCVKNSYLASFLCMLESYFNKVTKIYNSVDLYIAPSEFIRNKFIEFGFSAERIVHIPNLLDIPECSSSKNTSTAVIASGAERSAAISNYIVYSGRLAKEKGINVLIDAFINNSINCKLKIVGAGLEKEGIKQKIKDNDLENKIEVLGHKSGKDLQRLIANAKFVVVPSLWYENYPYSVLEPLALGRAVIGSEIGGIPELVINNKTGLLFKSGDAQDLANKINYLLNNPEEARNMGKAGRMLVEEQCDPGYHYKKLEDIYLCLTKDKEKANVP